MNAIKLLPKMNLWLCQKKRIITIVKKYSYFKTKINLINTK